MARESLLRCQGRSIGSSLLLHPVCILDQSSHQADDLESWLDCFVLCEEVTHVLLCLRLALGHKPKDPGERRQSVGMWAREERHQAEGGVGRGGHSACASLLLPKPAGCNILCTVSCVRVVCICLRGHGMCPCMCVEVGVGCRPQLLSTNFETRFLTESRAHPLARLASQ